MIEVNTAALNPLVDLDIVRYRVGFACKDDEPVENCLHSVKLVVQGILDAFPERTFEKMYLTGKGNFRDAIATVKKYKGNRDGKPKPKYYNEIGEYLVKHWGAQVVEGMEADDAIGIEQWKAGATKDTVIVTIDKDLNMIPGWHYNFVKQSLTYIPLTEANRFFWWQMMVGDTTDNIPGIDKIGPKTADKIIAGCNDDLELVKHEVTELYKKQYGDEWKERMEEVATLLWIKRKLENDRPPV